MCCWVYKPKGVDMISREEMEKIVVANPDGIGIAYTYNGSLYFAKGFMSFAEFEKFYNVLEKTISIKDSNVLFHSRITTTKSVKPFQCHPFVVTDNEKDLSKLHGEAELVFVHNGSMQNFYSFNKKLSDTQNFDLHILSKMQKLNPKFYLDEFYLKWIEDLTQKSNDSYNRFCFMDKDGNATFVGDVVKKENGIVYSNENHCMNISSYFDAFYTEVTDRIASVPCVNMQKHIFGIINSDNEIVDVVQPSTDGIYYINKNNDVYICEEINNMKLYFFTGYKIVLLDKNTLSVSKEQINLSSICHFTSRSVYFANDILDDFTK